MGTAEVSQFPDTHVGDGGHVPAPSPIPTSAGNPGVSRHMGVPLSLSSPSLLLLSLLLSSLSLFLLLSLPLPLPTK